MIHFDNSFQSLPAFLYEVVKPTPIKNPKLIHSTELKSELGLSSLTDHDLMQWLNGEKRLSGDQTISTRYAGHQFGVWAGQLGDGRAISLGEILTQNKGRLEVQTKGSGLTPFSRMGDGKAVIRSSVREYLCSEAMYGLGIPTTRVLALLTGEDKVYRETVERSAVVARVFPSNLRFGHFEMCFHFQKKDELKALIDYTRKTFFNDAPLEEMLKEVVRRTAALLAQWQSVGFCHGVMNTDNLSVLGLTIDYGPYGFLEDTNLTYICNHSDYQGRYAYNQQPQVAMWNLERFLICFIEILPKEKLSEILNTFPDHFEKEYLALSRKKLGFYDEHQFDFNIFSKLLKTLSDLSIDYTFFFRQLSLGNLDEIWAYYGNREELKNWYETYQERLSLEATDSKERVQRMLLTNPKYIIRNYIAQEIIEDVERGNSEKLKGWLEVLYRPFEEHGNYDQYSRPTPPEHKNYEISCSS